MRKLILTGIAVLAGMLLSSAPASAQVICSFDANPSLDGGGTPVGFASGSFHVVITKTGGSSYSVDVTGNADGNTAPGGPGLATPKSGIGTISLNFFDTGGNVIVGSTTLAGATTAYVGPVGGNEGPSGQFFGATGGAWAADPPGATVRWTTSANGAFVAPHGGNTFTGAFLVTGTIGTVRVSLQDSGQQFNGICVLTPEPASLALALPALLPLGLVALRSRRRGRPENDESEADELA